MSKATNKLFLAFSILAVATSSHAIDITSAGTISSLENGWAGEGLAIIFSSPSDGCPASDNEYAIDKNHPAYKELVSIAIAAFSAGSAVQLVVEKGTCIFGDRTKTLSIRIFK